MLKNAKYLLLLACIIFFSPAAGKDSFSQQKSYYSLGVNSGLSSFESLSATVTGLHIGLFYEFPTWFTRAFNFKASLFYIRKTEYFLPEDDNGKYYPYFYGGMFSGVMRQRIKHYFFAEEEAGLLLMKNKFFSDIDETNYGVCFGLGGGIDLRNDNSNGFLISICYKGGITFNASSPSFNSFYLQGQYFFN